MLPVQWTREFSNVRNSSGSFRLVINLHVMYVGACDHVHEVHFTLRVGGARVLRAPGHAVLITVNELKIGSKNQLMIKYEKLT